MYILCNIDIYIYIYILPSASACLSVAWQTWPRSRSQLLPKNLVLFAKWKQKNHRKCLRRTIKNTRWKKKWRHNIWMKESLIQMIIAYPEQQVSIHVTWFDKMLDTVHIQLFEIHLGWHAFFFCKAAAVAI